MAWDDRERNEQRHNGTEMALDVGGWRTLRNDMKTMTMQRCEKTLSSYTDNDNNIYKDTMLKQECVLGTAYIDNKHGRIGEGQITQTAARSEEQWLRLAAGHQCRKTINVSI